MLELFARNTDLKRVGCPLGKNPAECPSYRNFNVVFKKVNLILNPRGQWARSLSPKIVTVSSSKIQGSQKFSQGTCGLDWLSADGRANCFASSTSFRDSGCPWWKAWTQSSKKLPWLFFSKVLIIERYHLETYIVYNNLAFSYSLYSLISGL